MYATFCPCCAICDVAEWSGDNKFLMCCCGNICCVAAYLRSNVRKTLNIEGGFCNDLLCACCCPACIVCQELNEIKERTGGEEANKYGIKKGFTYDVEGIKAKMAVQGGQAPQQGYPPQY